MSFVAESRERSRPVLPLAALVDILFLLLVFFMVASAFKEQESVVDVSLPPSETAEVAGPPPLVITISEGNEIYIGQRRYTLDQLRAELTAIQRDYPDEAIVIYADREARHGTVFRVMDTAYAVGMQNVMLGAVKPESDL